MSSNAKKSIDERGVGMWSQMAARSKWSSNFPIWYSREVVQPNRHFLLKGTTCNKPLWTLNQPLHSAQQWTPPKLLYGFQSFVNSSISCGVRNAPLSGSQLLIYVKVLAFTYLIFFPANRLFKTGTLSPGGSGRCCLSSSFVCLRLFLVNGVRGGGIPFGASGLAFLESLLSGGFASSPVRVEETSLFSGKVPKEWSAECSDRHHRNNPRWTPKSPVENVKDDSQRTPYTYLRGEYRGVA